MKKTLVSLILVCTAGIVLAQSWGTAAPAVGTHTQDESLRMGTAKMCTIVGSRATNVAASNATQAFGTFLGSTAGVAVLSKHTDNTAAKIMAAGIGAGVGLKAAQKFGSTPGVVIYLQCGSAGDLITVTQDGTPQSFSKGQMVVLEQSQGHYRVVSI